MLDQQPTLTQPEPTNQQSPKPRDRRALSALRHGLTGQIQIFTPTDKVAYDKHCHGYHQSLAPIGMVETDIVQAIADDRWRLKRAAALENSIFADGISLPDTLVAGHPEIDTALAQGRVWLQKDGSLQLLTLYENRIQRRFERNMAELRRLQADRQAALDRVADELALILQLAEAEGEAYDVERDYPREILPPNFVFSTLQIARLAAHRRRLLRAKTRNVAPLKPLKIAA